MPDLFSQQGYQPLASRMRPTSLDHFVGQEHLLGQGKALRIALEDGLLHSMVLWGPPGTGKTTLAKMVAQLSDAHFESLSAVMSGVKDIRAAVERAESVRLRNGRKTILFVDEVHRFNKAQQDAFLPYIENGTLIFIGATTENPSFELNNALLSRVRVYLFRPLEPAHLAALVERALSDPVAGYGGQCIDLDESVRQQLLDAADGDARRVLNILEIAVDLGTEASGITSISQTTLEEVLQGNTRRFDKGGDLFYEQISALHKAVRGSAPDAALYWFARMIDGGCDPLYIARRLVRMASEDIGNADPRALQVALNAWETYERLGSPEGELVIAQAVIFMASAAKSNATYLAYKAVMSDIRKQPSYDVPMHLRNAPTGLMKSMDYGAQYRYAHDEPGGYAPGENYFPEPLKDQRYYYPVDRGLELKIGEKLQRLREVDQTSVTQRYPQERER